MSYEQLVFYSDLWDDAQTPPVPPEVVEAIQIGLTENPDAVVIGINGGFTFPPTGIGQGPTGGVEAVINGFNDTSIFYYDGVMTGPGTGGSITPYGGAVWNLETNSDYKGDFESLSATVAMGHGANVTVFWAPDFTADKPFGISIGPVAGAEVSLVHSKTFYRELLTNRGQ